MSRGPAGASGGIWGSARILCGQACLRRRCLVRYTEVVVRA